MTAECECGTCQDLRVLGRVAGVLAGARKELNAVNDVEVAEQVRADIDAIAYRLTLTARLAA